MTLFAFFCFTHASAMAQETVALNVSVTPAVPQPGETVTLRFETENESDAALFFYGLEVGYDASRFSFEGIDAGELMGENPLQIADNLNETTIGASVVRTSGAGSGAGNLVTMEFTALPGADEGSALFSFNEVDLRDDAGNNLSVDIPASAEASIQEGEHFTVYYNNPNGWEEVFTYAFSSEDGDYVSFPGEAMTPPEADSDWYSYDIPVTFNGAPMNRVIFNNGGNGEQTEDLVRDTDGWYDGTRWYDSEPDLDATRPVTFSVDLSAQVADGSFNPETEDVSVAGSFNDWSTTDLVLESAGDFIYEGTVDITGPETLIVEYKYVAAGEFEGSVGSGSDGNRVLELGPADTPQILDTVFFNNEVPNPDTRPVTFSVDMSVQIAEGNFDPITDEVYLRGINEGWDAEDALVMDESQEEESVYEITVSVEGPETGMEEYKYYRAPADDFEAGVYELEGEENRVLELGPADTPQTLETVFFDNEAPAPDPDTREVTFSVDMSVQIAEGNFDPEVDEATLTGAFTGWENNITLEEGAENLYTTTLSIEGDAGSTQEYKFGINGELEGVVGEGENGNRILTLGPADEAQILDTVFFNNEDEFIEPDSRPVTFSVDMSVQQTAGIFDPGAGDVVYVAGSFNEFLPTQFELTETADDVYETTLSIEGEADQTAAYKFYIDAGDDRELPNNGWELINDDPDENRIFTLGPPNDTQILDTVFFNNDEGDDLPETVTVWPGDTNNDGGVNEEDVLPLGSYWNATGPLRENASTDWEGQEAEVWAPVEATYADTDGSGLVNQTDLLAVGLNFGESRIADPQEDPAPLTEVSLPAINESDKIIVQLRSIDNVSLLGASFGISMMDIEAEEFSFAELQPGGWALEWLDDNALLEFDRTQALQLSAAAVHKGLTDPRISSTVYSFEINALTNWTSGATLLLERASYVDETGEQLSFEDIQVSYEVVTGTSTDNGELPATTALHQNYPNPFNPTTNIAFDLQESSKVTLEVLNLLGQRVALLADGQEMSAGSYTQSFDASRLTSGMYLIRLSAGEQHFTRKMMLVK
jgi:hypothetical protein